MKTSLEAHHRHKEYALGAALLTAGPLFILGTNPEQLPLPLLLVPYLLAFLTLFILGKKLVQSLELDRRYSGYKTNALIAVGATLPVLLLILQSLRQFTFRDLALVVALGIGVTFYLLRADFLQ